MRVLVACEYSGRVRDAFIAKGHDAVSCDLTVGERMKFDQDSIRGYIEAMQYLRSLPNWTELLNSEQSTDGWTIVALANSLWDKRHDPC